jgi:phage major head subunit gpT-like protein
MELTPALLQSFFVQLDMRYQSAYQRRKTFWPNYAELMPSGTETNVYSWLAELPGLRQWIGPRLVRNIAARSYSLTNLPFENTFAVDKNKIADDQAGVYGKMADLQGDAAARWPDDIVTSALMAGNSTLVYDGTNFFSTSHPVDLDDASQGTYSNLFATTPLNQANYATVKAAMRSYKGESGKPLEIEPTLMIVGPSLEQVAKEVTGANLIARVQQNVAGTENVALAGVTNVYQGDITLLVVPRLAADTAGAWYLASTDRIKPLIFQQRQAPTRTAIIDPQNPVVFNQRQFMYGVDARGAAGYGLPFLMTRATP